jgi:hypothetical protein
MLAKIIKSPTPSLEHAFYKALLVVVVTAAASANSSAQQVAIWTNSTGSGVWGDPANWTPNVLPGFSTYLRFDSHTQGSPGLGDSQLDSDYSIPQLTAGLTELGDAVHTIDIPAGRSLTIRADSSTHAALRLGTAENSFDGVRSVQVEIGGDGSLEVSDSDTALAQAEIGWHAGTSGALNSTISLSGLREFIATVDRFGVSRSNGGPTSTELTLARHSTIVANHIDIGNTIPVSNSSHASRVWLNEETLWASDLIDIGHGQSVARVDFLPSVTAPILNITDRTGDGGATLRVGYSANFPDHSTNSLLDTSRGTWNATLDQLVIGHIEEGNGRAIATVRMGSGTVTANGILMSTVAGALPPTSIRGILSISDGGSLTVNGAIRDGGGISDIALSGGARLTAVVTELGTSSSSNSTISVLGESTVLNAQQLVVGNFGQAAIVLLDGSTLQSQAITLGASPSGSGLLTISGDRSAVTTRLLRIGGTNISQGLGVVSIAAGASVNSSISTVVHTNGTLRLTDGQFSTPTLEIKTGAKVDLQGGAFEVDLVFGSLTNAASTLSLPAPTDTINLLGDYSQGSAGTMAITIANGQSDNEQRVNATGMVQLAGTLEVQFTDSLPPITPQLGDKFGVVRAGNQITGAFDHLELPTLSPDLSWRINYATQSVSLEVAPTPDFNRDQLIDLMDIDLLVRNILSGSTDLAFDLTRDARVDPRDITQWLSDAGQLVLGPRHTYKTGDANLDGMVDSSDLRILQDHLFSSNQAWSSGDFNVDGMVDVRDFHQWLLHQDFSAADSAYAVPEPALGISLASLLLVRRRLH